MATEGHVNELVSVLGVKSSLQKLKTDVIDPKANKSESVSTIAWSSNKLTKTINGATSDVVTAATIKTALSLAKGDVGLGSVTNDALVKRTEMGTANGVATLDANGKVPDSQLPASSGKEVVEGYYYNSAFYTTSLHTTAITPSTEIIYIDLVTNIPYIWNGSAYVKLTLVTYNTVTNNILDVESTILSLALRKTPQTLSSSEKALVLTNLGITDKIAAIRNITFSTVEPHDADGNNGDIWFVYED